MANTDKALGAIGALHTLIRNFPMSILDLFKGKVYTSAFDFIIDILYACGVDAHEITQYLLEKIYSFNIDIADLDDKLRNNYLTEDLTLEQSKFLSKLEDGMKEILAALLSSIFTCSAIPVIPNKHLDHPSTDYFGKGRDNDENKKLLSLWERGRYPENITIPISYIDPMGMLDITPTSSEGRMYYMVEGRDIYYKKVKKDNEQVSTFSLLKNRSIENISLYLSLNDNYISFNIDTPINENIDINIGYIAYDDNNLCEWNTKIYSGEIESNEIFKLLPNKNNSKPSVIKWIKLNHNTRSFKTFDGNIVLLDKEKSMDVIEFWLSKGANSINDYVEWFENNNNSNERILGTTLNTEYEYIECGYNKQSKGAIRVIQMPQADENSPEYIVYYEGIPPTELYKTLDMNAFIWYCLRRGMKNPYNEFNHMMWDSRLSARKKGITRNGNSEWNEWYNTKRTPESEFKYKNNVIKKGDALFPIIQLQNVGSGYDAIGVTFPSQTYFKPRVRNYRVETEDFKSGPSTLTAFNAMLYRFNKDYLDNIQILRPKLMLVGLCNYLLGFAINEVFSTKVNLTKKIIEAKLSTAVKKIIEAGDMEVEDCYTKFSNEEFEELLKDMQLSRYDATYYGGETTKIKVHDVNEYINTINSINDNTDRVNSIEVINKLVTEVIGSPTSEGSIDYGVQVSMDGNILNKLIWAITMPIVESLFTPQVMLLLTTNYILTGLIKVDEFGNVDLTTIINILMNHILGLIKIIIRFIIDLVIEILLEFFYEKVLPLLVKYVLALELERLNRWLEILAEALSYVPRLDFLKRKKIISTIDEVNYADITNIQNIPENSSGC